MPMSVTRSEENTIVGNYHYFKQYTFSFYEQTKTFIIMFAMLPHFIPNKVKCRKQSIKIVVNVVSGVQFNIISKTFTYLTIRFDATQCNNALHVKNWKNYITLVLVTAFR